MSKKQKGPRVQVQFVKRNGKVARFWTDAPVDWDAPRYGRDGWVESAAHKYHPGATDAKVVNRG